MVLKLKSSFNMEEDHGTSSSSSSSIVVGLRILTQNTSLRKSNIVVVKPAFKINLPDSENHSNESSGDQPCFLKSCHLCHKILSLDKEVYMYRGDQGFCSVECRERQIALDEMKELELSTKQMLSSHRYCNVITSGRQEIRLLIEDLRRRNQSPHQNRNQNHWAIVS